MDSDDHHSRGSCPLRGRRSDGAGLGMRDQRCPFPHRHCLPHKRCLPRTGAAGAAPPGSSRPILPAGVSAPPFRRSRSGYCASKNIRPPRPGQLGDWAPAEVTAVIDTSAAAIRVLNRVIVFFSPYCCSVAMKLLMCCKQLKSRQHDRRLVVLVFAFATLSVNRIALRETGREIEMYPSASKLFGLCCCDCNWFLRQSPEAGNYSAAAVQCPA